jgi:hypothetical protein
MSMLSKNLVGEHNLTANLYSFISLRRLHADALLAFGLVAESV